MNLKDYFQRQQQTHMSDTDKLNLYQDFMIKNMKSHYARKRSFLHIKSLVYSTIAICFLFSLYGVYFFTGKYSEYEGLVINSNNAVQASYIAKVIDFNGSFYIEHAGNRVQTSIIQNGDIVTLKENTQLVCQINSGTTAKLIGPAQFSIEQVSAGKIPQYKLNVIQGDFVEMESMQAKSSEKIQLTLKDTITVQETNDKAFNYQLIKTGGQHIIKNGGGAISVTTIDKNNKQTKTNLNDEQVLAISNNDIRLFDNMKKFTDAMKTNNISQTFTFNAPQETIDNIIADTGTDIVADTGTNTIDQDQSPQEVPLASLLNTTDEKVSPEVSSELGSLFSDTKKVVTPDQNQAMRSTLNTDFLLSNIGMGGIYKSLLKGDETGLTIAYNSVEGMIAKLYKQFNLSYTEPSGATIQENLLQLKTSIASFITSVKNQYTLPDKYFDDLTIFVNRLDYLAGQKLGGDVGNTDQDWSNLLQALPAKLTF